MSEPANAKFQQIEYADRFFIQNARGAISGIVQIAEEIASNEDEAISRRADREHEPDRGQIVFRYDPVTADFSVSGDGDGMTAAKMVERLGRVGEVPQHGSKRSYFHRGVRDVFLAMGSGEVSSIGLNGDGEYVFSKCRFEGRQMAMVAEDRPATDADRELLGTTGTGTLVSVPVGFYAKKKPRQFEFAQIESQLRDCVGLRAVMADENREVSLRYGDELPRRLRFEYPDGEDLVVEQDLEIAGHAATLWVQLAEKPFNARASARTRQNGILIRSERACYEVVSGPATKSHPAMSRVFGELRMDDIETIQRAADFQTEDEAELIYQPDRSGLNKENPIVQEILDDLDKLLDPLIADLEASQPKKSVTSDVRRQLQKLAREINKVVQEHDVRDATGPDGPAAPRVEPDDPDDPPTPPQPSPWKPRQLADPLEFATERIFMSAGTKRTVKLFIDTARIPAGERLVVASTSDELVPATTLSTDCVPEPSEDDGIAEVSVTLVSGESEGRHEVRIECKSSSTELPVHVRFPRASGFITSIILEDLDWPSGSALWDPSSGVVRVFVGRPEFVEAARDANREGLDEAKAPSYRQLIVESVREAALWSAAERNAEVEWDDLTQSERNDPHSFQQLVRVEFQSLDYLLRAKLLRAFS